MIQLHHVLRVLSRASSTYYYPIVVCLLVTKRTTPLREQKGRGVWLAGEGGHKGEGEGHQDDDDEEGDEQDPNDALSAGHLF